MPESFQHDALAALAPAVRALVAHVLGSRLGDADVEDAANEVFRRAIEGYHRLERGTSLRPWLLGIARHVALDARRTRRRALARTPDLANVDGPASVVEGIADARPGPEERLQIAERSRRVQAALEALPSEQRRAIWLHAEGLGYREIGEHLRVPLGTVCTWIARARRQLALALRDEAR